MTQAISNFIQHASWPTLGATAVCAGLALKEGAYLIKNIWEGVSLINRSYDAADLQENSRVLDHNVRATLRLLPKTFFFALAARNALPGSAKTVALASILFFAIRQGSSFLPESIQENYFDPITEKIEEIKNKKISPDLTLEDGAYSVSFVALIAIYRFALPNWI